MTESTAKLLNRLTSSFSIFLGVFVIMNLTMMFVGPDMVLILLGGWLGTHIGLMWFGNVQFWKSK